MDQNLSKGARIHFLTPADEPDDLGTGKTEKIIEMIPNVEFIAHALIL